MPDSVQSRGEVLDIASAGGDFTGVLIKRADLSGIDLARVNLTGARVEYVTAEGTSFREAALRSAVLLGVLLVAAAFYDQHFPLLMLASVLLYVVVCLGLNLQFGYAGVVNFAGAAFFGIGCVFLRLHWGKLILLLGNLGFELFYSVRHPFDELRELAGTKEHHKQSGQES